MTPILFTVPTLLGVESLAAEELRRMGLASVRAENGRIYAEGSLSDIPRINLRLRTGERLLIVLGSFTATSFEDLFEGTRALPWEDWIPQDGKFPVKGFSLQSKLQSVPACQSIIKKAVATRLAEAHKTQSLPETASVYQIQFSLMKDKAMLMLDTSGDPLYKRGYRANGVVAPLRETLAAAMVMLSGYRGKDVFCDPFCGSGTIAIEAALIAKNRAPGLNRKFSAQKWAYSPTEDWLSAADEAMDLEYDGDYKIFGTDIDPQAIALSQENAVKADVEDIVQFQTADATCFYRPEASGRIVTNPPYGERIMARSEAEELYRAFGEATKALSSGWSIHLLSSHTEFERTFGRRADKKRKLYNGMLKCDLFQYRGKKLGKD